MAAGSSLLLRDDRAIASQTFMEVLLLSFESGVPVHSSDEVDKESRWVDQVLGEIGELKR